MARQGKIARLPHVLREEVNRRLLDGQTSGKILGWLNDQADAREIWEDQFEGMAASSQNLSEWRAGGYREWRARKEKTENLKTLSCFAKDLAKSGGSIADGAAAILGGQILEVLESAANLGGGDDEGTVEQKLATMAGAVASMQRAATARGKLELDRKKVRQKDKSLALDQAKFETQTAAKFLDWANSPDARAILDSGKSKHIKMDLLRELMFGPAGKEAAENE